ncbi:MAG: UDP-N-acetylmuramoyl-L-alanine--D-glutamate ligase [Actinobacteria bacterium]|nr:UDP-N-acetylmuramoyl-L-alanine--D-glutamate ligase [Actinomycetota bacterium]
MDLSDVRCLVVLGLRRSGRPAALLARREVPAAARVVALDEGAAPRDDTVAVLEAAGVEVLTGPAAVLPGDADVLVKSPGVPDSSAAVREAVRRGVPIWSEVEFASRFLTNPVIGITGTNGKTTTTELTGALLRDAGLPVAVGGNIGFALAAMPGEIPPGATVVAELSSFQLEHVRHFRPAVAVLLNLTPDHLDRHGTYRAYVDAKLRIFECQTPDDAALLCADDAGVLAEYEAGRLRGEARRGWFSAVDGLAQGPGGEELVAGVEGDVLWVRVRGELRRLCRRDELALRGEHNVLNSLAAAAAACAVGVSVGAAAATLRTFAGVPHRLQVAGEVGGVTYVNDSKATNVDATLKALTAYHGGVHLILGGYDKGAEFGDLAAATEGRVRQALLIGATAPRLEEAFAARAAAAGSAATPYVVCGDLPAAVQAAAAVARPGDVVLLSPACASWDQYRDYEERGEHFLELVSELRARS